jgi:hypothetical protein
MTQKKCTGRRTNPQEIFCTDKDSFKELLRPRQRTRYYGLNFHQPVLDGEEG